MMGTFVDYISNSREMLKNCLELCDSLEKDFFSENLSDKILNKKLSDMKQKISGVKNNILEAEKVKISRRHISKKQNGGCTKESAETDQALSHIVDDGMSVNISNILLKDSEEADKIQSIELIEKMNHVAKEAILNESDLESCEMESFSPLRPFSVVLADCNANTAIEDYDMDVDKLVIDEPENKTTLVEASDEPNETPFGLDVSDSKIQESDFDDSGTIITETPIENCHTVVKNIDDSILMADKRLNNEEYDISNNLYIQEGVNIHEDMTQKSSQNRSEIHDKENSHSSNVIFTKECCVVLQDIAKGDEKDKFYKAYFKDLDKEVNKLSQLPKFKKINSMKNDTPKEKKSNTEQVTKSSKTPQIDSEDNGSDSDQESVKSVEVDITDTVMIDTPSESSNNESSDDSSDNFKVKSKRSKNDESNSNKRAFDRRITRSLRIPIMSDSETSQKTELSNEKSKKNSKHASKTILLSSTSDEESDASASDLRKGSSKRKKSMPSKSKSKRQKVDNEEDVVTRKNIHKIINKSKLSEATKTAEQFEMERRKRMEEKQEMYNRSLLKDNEITGDNVSALILEKSDSDEYVVEVHQHIADKLKKHQVDAVHFMYDCVIESVDCLLKSQSKETNDQDKTDSAIGGCILAHCMGLGKTLALIAFMHTMLTTPVLNLYTCIVVCPVNTAINWRREWEMWMPSSRPVKIFEVCTSESKQSKVSIVQDWYKKGGVLIIGYEMFRLLATGDSRTIRNKLLRQKMLEALVNPGADFMVCDEGHLLKNEKSAISKVINQIKTLRRIVLTGTPLQNRLLEYHTMVNFVKPNLLGTNKEFLNRFVNPISNGQHINSTPYDVKIMKKRSHILFRTLDGCVHRRDYSALVKYLPPKFEYVIKIRMSDLQIQLYNAYLSMIRINRQSLFQDQMNLARIWTHPLLICMHQEVQNKKMFLVDTDEESFIEDEDSDSKEKIDKRAKKPLEENNIINISSDESIIAAESDEKEKKKSRKKSESESSVDEVVRNWSTHSRTNKRNDLCDSDEEPKINFELENIKDTPSVDKHWWSEIIKPEHENTIEISGKLTVLFQILRKAGEIGDKVIIFTQSLPVLDIIERFLLELHTMAEKVNQDLLKLNEPLNGEEVLPEIPSDTKNSEFFSNIGFNTWEKGIDYDRMDGGTHVNTRADIQARFNSVDDRRLRLFLVSTRAGGMGVNLVSANRVIIFDVSWNPSNDIQAIFRSYRFGQNKPVYVYRLVSQGTMEEKMYERQVTKLSLSLRVVDEQQISRYFTEEDLRSLYKFTPDIYDPDKERETPILPKDRFLAEMIKEFPQWIYGYHEHDSLLQNKDEEDLTEAERQEAWKEFEDEKLHGTRPSIAQISFDPNQFAQIQMNQMNQLHPQYASLYSQNYLHLLRYALNQQPDLKTNPAALSLRMQNIFFSALQKHNSTAVGPTTAVTTVATVTPTVPIAPAHQASNGESTSMQQ